MEPAVEPDCSARLSKPLVLVVDDEPFILRYIERVLQIADYRVITVTTVEEAWKLFQQHQMDIELVLSDVVMPGSVGGLELAEKIHQFVPALPVVFITGALSELDSLSAMMYEKQQLLRKPFSPKELVDFIGSQLRRPSPSGVMR
jgi:two-component system, cell cycle sensor histidine kinase and response regulator CckA